MTECFPELRFLGKLEAGTVLDGELRYPLAGRRGKGEGGGSMKLFGRRGRRVKSGAAGLRAHPAAARGRGLPSITNGACPAS